MCEGGILGEKSNSANYGCGSGKEAHPVTAPFWGKIPVELGEDLYAEISVLLPELRAGMTQAWKSIASKYNMNGWNPLLIPPKVRKQ